MARLSNSPQELAVTDHGVGQPNQSMEAVDVEKVISLTMEMDQDQDCTQNSFSVLFDVDDEILGKDLQRAWPVVKLRLALLKISAKMNLHEGSMTVSTNKDPKSSGYAKAKILVQLLASAVPATKAINVLSKQFGADIIKIGFQEDGLCSKFGITEEQFLRRRSEGLDAVQLKAIYEQTGCELFVRDDIVAAIGPSPGSLRLARWAVEGCVVRKTASLPPSQGLLCNSQVAPPSQLNKLTALRI